MITIFAKTSSSLCKKRHFFAKCFGENIFKNHNIGPIHEVPRPGQETILLRVPNYFDEKMAKLPNPTKPDLT
jgi:hypothetical protein